LIGSDVYRLSFIDMSETENIDEMTLRQLWGNEITQLTPEVKSIIVAALKKVRERKERKSR
jgi:hypothetical protein